MHKIAVITIGAVFLFLLAALIKSKKITERMCYWIVFIIALGAVGAQFLFPGHIHAKWVFPAFAAICGLLLLKEYFAPKPERKRKKTRENELPRCKAYGVSGNFA